MEKRTTVSSSHLARGIACRLSLCCKPGPGSAAEPSICSVALCTHHSKAARLHELFSLIMRNLVEFRSVCEHLLFTVPSSVVRRIQLLVS